MVSKIVLHSWMNRGIGLGFADLLLSSHEGSVLYVTPSANLLPTLQRKLAAYEKSAIEEGDGNGSLLARVEFSTFDQLTRRLLPIQDRRLMLQEEQEWLIRQAAEDMVQQGLLVYFANSINYSGWVKRLGIWIGEVKRAGISEQELVRLWNDKERKYQELAGLYTRYQKLLTQYELMDHEEAYRLLVSDPRSDFPKTVYFEHFDDLTPLQFMVIQHLHHQGSKMHFHLLDDSLRHNRLFARTTQTINRLSSLGFIVEQAADDDGQNELDPVLYHAQKYLFASSFPARIQAQGQIRLFRTAGNEKECRLIAARVKRLIRDEQISPGKIAIITANPEHDQNLLHAAFQEAKIPADLAKREYLHKLTLLQAIFSLLQARMGQREAFISFIHSPYFSGGIFHEDEKQIRRLLYPLFRHLGHPMRMAVLEERWEKLIQFGQKLPGTFENWLQAKRALSGLLRLTEQVPLHATAAEYGNWLLAKLSGEWGLDRRLRQLWAGDEHWQYYNRDLRAIRLFKQAINELVQVSRLSDRGQPISLSTFINRLRQSCEEKQVVYWDGMKHGVKVLHPNAIRGQRFHTVFIMGLMDGGFPRTVRNDWLMPDEIRMELLRKGYDLPLSWDYGMQQEWQFFQSVAAAEHRLYLSYPATANDGTQHLPSPFLHEMEQIIDPNSLNTETWEMAQPVATEWEDCLTTEEWKEKVLLSGRDLPASWDEIGVMKRIGIERGRLYGPWDAYDGLLAEPALLEVIDRKFLEMVWSPTQLNQLVQCRHAFFNRYILKLNAWREEEETLHPADRGNLFHTVLYRFFSRYRGKMLKPDSRMNYQQELLKIFTEESEKFAEETGFHERNPALWPVEKRRLTAQLLRILDHELHWREQSGGTLAPSMLELAFGISERQTGSEYTDPASVKEVAKLTLGGEILRLRGKIDRVDMDENGHFVVYDYKSGMTAKSAEIRQGLHLQLPLYLQVLEHHFGFARDKVVGAAFYTAGDGSGKQDNRNTGLWHEERMSMAGISRSLRNAKVAAEEWDLLFEQINDVIYSQLQLARLGNFTFGPDMECPAYCEYRHICRYDKERAQRKEEQSQ